MVDFDGKHIAIPSWEGVSRQVAEVWRLEKDAHSAVCSVWTHPMGVNPLSGKGRFVNFPNTIIDYDPTTGTFTLLGAARARPTSPRGG
jgi:hypothetical protein